MSDQSEDKQGDTSEEDEGKVARARAARFGDTGEWLKVIEE